MDSFYSYEELYSFNFKHLGNNVKVSRKCSIYNPQNIELHDHVRVDDFAILSAGKNIYLGRYVHIAAYAAIFGRETVFMNDFSGLSSKVTIYSSTADYTAFMTNPQIPEKLTNIISKEVFLGKHVVVGSGSTILPGVVLSDGCAVGAMSLVKDSFPILSIIAGIPAKIIKERNSNIFKLEEQL